MKRSDVLIFILLFTVCVSCVRSQWIQTNGPVGTSIMALAANDTNLYVGTWGNRVHLSANYGASWNAVDTSGLTDPYIYSLASNGLYIIVGNYTGIFRSTNRGSSWTLVDTVLTRGRKSALVFRDTIVFLTVSGKGLFRSTNYGTSWTAISTGLPNSDFESLAVDGSNIFAQDHGKVFLSTNSGTSWIPIDTLLTNYYSWSIAVRGSNLFLGTDGGVFVSTNRGAGWRQFNFGLTNVVVRSLVVSGTNLFLGLWNGVVWRRPMWQSTVVPPVAPMLLSPLVSAINISLNPILSWNPSAGATSYELQVSPFSNFISYVFDDTTAGTSQVIGPLNLASTYNWRVRAKNSGDFSPFSTIRTFKTILTSAIEPLGGTIRHEYALSQNYPNPFNPSTSINYSLPNSGVVSLRIVNTLGQEVAMLVNEQKEAGYYQSNWNAANIPSGIYFYRIQAGGFVETKKMILLR